MIMTISLLLYTLAEVTLRQYLADTQQSIPDQRSKPIQTPTMRRVFQLFEGIDLLFITDGEQHLHLFLNLRDIHRQILQAFSPHV
jgi:transposase